MRALVLASTTLGALVIAGCSIDHDAGSDSRITVTFESTPTTPRPPLPHSYRYVLESSCGERSLLGRYRVVVDEGTVTSAVSLDDDFPYRPDLTEVPTLAGLVEKVESAGPRADVDLVLDRFGRPTSLRIDRVPAAIDDEECYEVSALEVLD